MDNMMNSLCIQVVYILNNLDDVKTRSFVRNKPIFNLLCGQFGVIVYFLFFRNYKYKFDII